MTGWVLISSNGGMEKGENAKLLDRRHPRHWKLSAASALTACSGLAIALGFESLSPAEVGILSSIHRFGSVAEVVKPSGNFVKKSLTIMVYKEMISRKHDQLEIARGVLPKTAIPSE
jgi:hypothetical protein